MAKDTTATANREAIVYFRDGQPMAKGHEGKLSTFAYLFTKDVKNGAPRISTTDLVALLKKLGVDDPAVPGWMVELPNGVTLEARRSGEAPKHKPQATEKSVPAKRVKKAAKKTPGQKRRESEASAKPRKAAAKKKSADKTQVTPLPKRATKKTVAAASARRRTTRARA